MPFPEPSPSQAVATATDLLGPWFRTLARSVQTGVVLVGPEGAPIFCNDAVHELLGLPASSRERALEWLAERIPPELRAGRGGVSAVLEVEAAPPAGSRHVVLRAVPLEGDDCGTLILVEDRTRMAALEASLVLASRVAAQSLLRSHVHDLKAPLNALSLNLALLRNSLEEENEEQEDVREKRIASTEVLDKEIKRLARSLDFFLRQTGQAGRARPGLRRLEVRRPVRETARLIRASAKSAGVRLRLVLPRTSTYVVADGDLLKQALLNLVLNALEAQESRESGEIRLRVECGAADVRILVEDDGPGIPAPLLDRVFEMNFTTKENGTGIGLTVARSLVEDQGGRLLVDSRPGSGTRIEIRLPRASAERKT